jgi:2-succinyl-5-enolpyruvyl-6-hydroxy-3-cyclohexene-1-carboxylate synthase
MLIFLFSNNSLAADNYKLCSLLDDQGFTIKSKATDNNINQSELCQKIKNIKNDKGQIIGSIFFTTYLTDEAVKLSLTTNLIDKEKHILLNSIRTEFARYANILFSKYVKCRIYVNLGAKILDGMVGVEAVCGKNLEVKSFLNSQDKYITEFNIYGFQFDNI